MNQITLRSENHRDFLQEGRRDPITKELLCSGMRVVICAECGIAFKAENWSGTCPLCGHTATLRDIPAAGPIDITRPKRRARPRVTIHSVYEPTAILRRPSLSFTAIVRRFIGLWFRAVFGSLWGAIKGGLAGILGCVCALAVIGLLTWDSTKGAAAGGVVFLFCVVTGLFRGCIKPLRKEAENSPFSKGVLFVIGAGALLFDFVVIWAMGH